MTVDPFGGGSDDRRYHVGRAREELGLSLNSRCGEAEVAHLVLATLHLTRAQEPTVMGVPHRAG